MTPVVKCFIHTMVGGNAHDPSEALLDFGQLVPDVGGLGGQIDALAGRAHRLRLSDGPRVRGGLDGRLGIADRGGLGLPGASRDPTYGRVAMPP